MTEISKKLIEYLTNYSKINSGIYIREGNVISTSSKDRTIFTKATVEEHFERDFAIYELDSLLNVLTMFESPQIVLKETHMVIIDGDNPSTKAKYHYVDPSLLIYSEKDLLMPSTQLEFELTSELLDQIYKASSKLKVEDIIITSENGRMVIKILDMDGKDSTNSMTIDIGENETGAEFLFRIKMSNLKLMKGDYTVGLLIVSKNGKFQQGMANFKLNSDELEYFVAIEPKSFYTE